MLPHQAIIEYMNAYKSSFGKEISFEQAAVKAEKLIDFYRLIYRPLRKEWLVQGQKEGETKNGN